MCRARGFGPVSVASSWAIPPGTGHFVQRRPTPLDCAKGHRHANPAHPRTVPQASLTSASGSPVVGLAVALGLLVTACGDDDSGGGPASIDEDATDGNDNSDGENSGGDNGGDASTDPYC